MNTKTAPFTWQDKRVLRRIREQCEDYSSALGVYLALTVAASDAGREEFQTTHKWLAMLSGFGERTVRSRLHNLEQINVISISTPALKTPSYYRLLPFGNGCRTSGNGCRAFGNGLAIPLPPSEVTKDIQTEKASPLGENPSSTPPPAGDPAKAQLIRKSFQEALR